MKNIFKTSLLLFILLSFSSYAQEAGFEGIIEFKKQTDYDTISYKYYIKGDKIRVDEVGSSIESVSGSYLIDLKEKKVIAVSHARHLYFEQPPSPVAATTKGTPEVIKTKNTKVILGQNCTEYIVKCKEENTQISYWLATGGYNFFSPMVKFLNRKDKSSVYFTKLTGVEGMFPFLSTETSLDGKDVKTKLEVVKIKKQKINAAEFNIPKGYQKSEN
jgi:hypothetical protein